jgi:hypothetical protein
MICDFSTDEEDEVFCCSHKCMLREEAKPHIQLFVHSRATFIQKKKKKIFWTASNAYLPYFTACLPSLPPSLFPA